MNIKIKKEIISPYEEIAIRTEKLKNLKQIASAIIVSALDDADVEFLTDDFEEWKRLRIKRKSKNECLNSIDYKIEFKYKEDYKKMLFDICNTSVSVNDIPKENIEEREKFESNCMEDLEKITSYKKGTLIQISKLHGWKIGIDYTKPTIFDI